MTSFDVAIIGAGPAGSTTAIALHNSGLTVALIDKNEFPRDKICGDALSGKSVKILEELDLLQDLDKLDGAIVNRIIFGNPNHSECELHLNKSLNKRHISHGFVIPRKIFDNYLKNIHKNYSEKLKIYLLNNSSFNLNPLSFQSSFIIPNNHSSYHFKWIIELVYNDVPLKIIDINPYTMQKNPYLDLARNFILYSAAYPVRFEEQTKTINIGKPSTALNVRIYMMSYGDINCKKINLIH